MSNEQSENPAAIPVVSSRYLVRVDVELTDVCEFEKHCVVMAESAEQAQIMVNKFLLSHLYFENFPDAFFAELDLVDSYHFQTDLEEHAELHDLLKAYEQEHGNPPIYEGTIYLGKLPEKKAYPYTAKPLSDAEYLVLSEFLVLNDATDLDTFI